MLSKALLDRGFRTERVPVLLCLCGEPVRAVHMDVSTPGFWSQPRLVSSLSTDSVSAVALAWMVSPADMVLVGERGESDESVGLLGAEVPEGIHKAGLVLAGLGMVAVANMATNCDRRKVFRQT